MDATERFVETVNGSDVALDVGAFCIAAHAHPRLDVDEGCRRLDTLAAECGEPSFDGMRHHLFAVHDFSGDTERYTDPENSFLDSVLRRERGIPITLSVVMMEVGRRIGVAVDGIGMPGHFLVQETGRRDLWCDPFRRGALLTYDDCKNLFAAVHGSTRTLEADDLRPTPPTAVLARMLANLERGPLASNARHRAWMCELHLAIPGIAGAELLYLLRLLARTADPRRFARAFDRVSHRLTPESVDLVLAEAGQHNARWN